MMISDDQPVAISIAHFCRLSSLGKTKTYELIKAGILRTKKVGRRTLIDMESVFDLIGRKQHNEVDQATLKPSDPLCTR